MNLDQGIEVLVRDWIDLHEQGGSKLSVEGVIKKLGVENIAATKAPANALQITTTLQHQLRQIPGAMDAAEKFMAQFSTPEELLDEIDFDSFVCDLNALAEDGL